MLCRRCDAACRGMWFTKVIIHVGLQAVADGEVDFFYFFYHAGVKPKGRSADLVVDWYICLD